MRLTALKCLAAFVCLFATCIPALAEPLPSREEMWRLIQAQQKRIETLEKHISEVDQKTEAVVDVVEAQANDESDGVGWWNNTQLGGYGELHYRGGDKDEIDFHRFVMFLSHQFDERLRLFSEVELEHSLSGENKPGEVELEQAFIEYDLYNDQRARAGLFLIPVGILNEVHEPPTFFGVERNPVESNIIPTTWWEGGVGFSGGLPAGLSYDLAFHSGLETPVSGENAFKIRSGRQKVAEASAEAGALTGRLKWQGIRGVEIAATAQFQGDVTQNTGDEEVEGFLFSSHADVRRGPFGLRTLFARWDLDGETPKTLGRDEQYGFYVEPGVYFDIGPDQVGFFGRYSLYDNEAGDSIDSQVEQFDVGLNYWPHENVVLKADFSFIESDAGIDDELLNLGVGFQY